MIERYTIKFGQAVSQKELEKKLHEDLSPDDMAKPHQMKGHIEFICDFADIKKLVEMLKSLKK